MEETIDIIDNLEEIKYQMLELLDQAICLIPEGRAKSRAECYWYAHIKTAITKEHFYLGGSMCTMDDTIEELRREDIDEAKEN
jgi:hypothetical protein